MGNFLSLCQSQEAVSTIPMSLNSNDKRRGGSELPLHMKKKVQKISKDPADTICLHDYWIRTTRFRRYLELFNQIFQESPFLLQKCQNEHFASEILHCLSLRSRHPLARKSLSRLIDIGDSRRGNRHIVVLALLFIACFEPSDGCFALIDRVNDRVFRCQSAQKQAYVLTLQHGAHVYECPVVEHTTFLSDKRVYGAIKATQQKYIRNHFAASSKMEQIPVDQMISSELCDNKRTEYGAHLQKVHSMIEDYLDAHKENAFKSALQEPARFYFELCRDICHKNHVNVHGLNGYLCLVRGWFGFQLPMIPLVDDVDTFKGCADVWKGLDEDAWTAFSDPKNFGKDFEGIKELNSSMLKSAKYGKGPDAARSFVGANAAATEKRANNKDRKLFPYAEKFAHFFSKDFLVKRMFEVLNAETKPEYIGFKASCDALFPLFKTGYNLHEETLSEYLYDEFMINLDIDKAAHFFWWCGICNDQCEIPYVDTNNVCPICFEEKDDLEQIPHWEAKGDVSGHKMCSDCSKKYTKDHCPFCNEVMLKDEMLNKIKNLILDVQEKSVEGNPNIVSRLFLNAGNSLNWSTRAILG
ncbi:hypothetical protein CTEN210_05996 [Chaetoceros tenuissimus]|uniref:RING-type domain-containing protein n=1 Tax=Chaetoceros tenuissimus TaxID=426638 RepID=A0AAD3H3Z6_9STRA|nr:hypothetical protein CTEN210_05996 [Chaetoceros tenuissimus]